MADISKSMLTTHMMTCEQMFERADDLSSSHIDDLNTLLKHNDEMLSDIKSSNRLDGWGLFATKKELLQELHQYNTNITNLRNSLKNRFPKP